MYCNHLESAANRGLVPASMILIIAPSHWRMENASVDSCRVARMTILILGLLTPTQVDDLPVYVYSP